MIQDFSHEMIAFVDIVDPDPMDLQGYEQKFFFDKTKNVLDQLQLGYSGYEVE